MRQPIDDAESLALMEEHGVGYSSTGLIARMRQNGNVWQEKVCLAMAQLVFLLGQACMWIACPRPPGLSSQFHQLSCGLKRFKHDLCKLPDS